MSAAAAGSGGKTRRRWASPGFETFGSIFGFAYTFLAVNLLLAVANAPLLLVLASTADPLASWPFLLLLSVTLSPSTAGAFAAFAALKVDDGLAVKPVAAFLKGYRRHLLRSLAAGTAAAAAVGFLVLDLILLSSMPGGAVLVPLAVLATAATILLAVTVLAGMVLLPGARLGSLFKAGLYLCARWWYLSIAALVVLGIIALAVLTQPVLGVALVPAPLLFVVWSNTAYAYSSALGASGD